MNTDDFEFTVRSRMACHLLYGHFIRTEHTHRRNLFYPLFDHIRTGSATRIGGRAAPVTIRLTNRTDYDLAVAPVLREVALISLKGTWLPRENRWLAPGVVATKTLTRLVRKLDDFLDVPAVERLAGLG